MRFPSNISSTIHPWNVFVSYQVVNVFSFLFNCYGKSLPAIGAASLYTSLISFLVILIVVPAKAPTHQQAKFVFANFVNGTGWNQNGIGEKAHVLSIDTSWLTTSKLLSWA
jgi:choline transport protein